MLKNENEQFICHDVPNLKLQLKNKNKIILETILDTLTFFRVQVGSDSHQMNFKVATLHPDEYRIIVENITSITEVNVTAEFLFRGNNDVYKSCEVTYPPFNRIVITKETDTTDAPSRFEFGLYKY